MAHSHHRTQKCFVADIGAYSVNEMAINWNSALVWLGNWAAEQVGGAALRAVGVGDRAHHRWR
ncbi:glycoside hydrolase family 9 protein [Micromonospora echinofusca]|uniref:glycoside hydrolase family 9 protein n=1 Tax=Micromonospora echinofusca TaxID=47858 RepID=UPI001AD672D2|nr:glycoside hydrolase family 9 protein [Micromonospora echinofusca]